MHKLIINSDDFGYGRGINHAIIDTYQEGILTSATLMTNTPGFDHAVKLALANPKLGVGVHLVLTFLKPLRDDVPSLVDSNGNFYRPNAYRQGEITVDYSDLYKEWDAQIQKVLDAGIQPTHLDSHHHVHTMTATHQNVFLDLAEKYKLPVRGNFQTSRSFKTTTFFEPAFDTVSTLDQFEQDNYLNDLVQRIKENKSTEIMCHTGYVDQFLFAHSSFIESRMYQVELLQESKFVRMIKSDEAIALVTFRDLFERP